MVAILKAITGKIPIAINTTRNTASYYMYM